MPAINLNDEPGKELLLMGNQAIARGALEAGVKVCTGYPGTPSSDIIENLAEIAQKMDIYVEWSANEKVALEVATAAAFSGLRAICTMKQNGLNVASDSLLNLNLIGIEGGLLLVTCDDPSAHSSTNEEDTRHFSKIADLPLLEPATFNEAKEMAKWAFDISEDIKNVCMMRGVTRISHARGNVTLGELSQKEKKPYFDRNIQRITFPIVQKHNLLHEKLAHLEKIFQTCQFNKYEGPPRPDLLIITCGSSWLYSQEAVGLMGLQGSVGILKIGTTFPLPPETIIKHLAITDKILIAEEVDSFLEGNVKELAVDFSKQIGLKEFFGKKSGHIPFSGEMNTDRIIQALSRILDFPYESRDAEYEAMTQNAQKLVPARVLGFCPGCPHRASYWSIKNALQLDDRKGFVTGDIGCYHLARTSAGWNLLKTSGAMGSGTGLSSGFGKLERFGFSQPTVAVCGDSTFFHAVMPALANAIHSSSNVVLAILDNSATAMTGFQSHPGVGKNAMGENVTPIDIENVCRAFGAKVEVTDPFDLEATKLKLLQMLDDPEGVKVLIMRRKCALLSQKEEKCPFKVYVHEDKCIGEECGCNRFCTRSFRCPGLIWDTKTSKAKIDEVICVGCGVCADICPEHAIVREEVT